MMEVGISIDVVDLFVFVFLFQIKEHACVVRYIIFSYLCFDFLMHIPQKRNVTRRDTLIHNPKTPFVDCDENQCIAGLVCGDNNCDKFHEIGVGTGLTPETDCCEGNCSHHDKHLSH